MTATIINGEINDHISIYDRGLQYGDGLFETIAIKNHKLLLWQDHIDRLNQGCRILNLPIIDEQLWLNDIAALNIPETDGVIKIILTRGSGGRGYCIPDTTNVSRIVSLHPWPEHPEDNSTKGIKTFFCETRVSVNSTLSGIKHLNRLENVIARNEWKDESIAEGIMLNDDEHIIEGTMSNIFSVNNDILYTPLLNKSGVKGVIRKNIIELARVHDIEVQEIVLSKEILLNMDEIFITNSLIGIWPVIKLHDRHFSLGKITSLLTEKLDMTQGAKELL